MKKKMTFYKEVVCIKKGVEKGKLVRNTANSVRYTGFESFGAKTNEEVCLSSKEDYFWGQKYYCLPQEQSVEDKIKMTRNRQLKSSTNRVPSMMLKVFSQAEVKPWSATSRVCLCRLPS